MIKNSEGSCAYKNNYALIDGVEVDITEDGNAACAYSVSWILQPFGLCKRIHAKTSGLVNDLIKESGWYDIDEPRPGCVFLYKPKYFENSKKVRDHIGLGTDDGDAISNDDEKRCLTQHPWNEYHERPCVRILWNDKLNSELLS